MRTKRLNQQVNRNQHRFPEDFAFTLTPSEKAEVVAKCNHLQALKFSQVMPRAFTEHGAIMAASVLNTPIAVQASILVVRAFVRLRAGLATRQELVGKLGELEKKIGTHDTQIRASLRGDPGINDPAAAPDGASVIGRRHEDRAMPFMRGESR